MKIIKNKAHFGILKNGKFNNWSRAGLVKPLYRLKINTAH